ncbi:MAG: ATP-grasp domain-containing protein [Dehalococcoidia bacterium]|nr:ATP-grasp domain-containing protein [Dehalococcoidia bacterium]
MFNKVLIANRGEIACRIIRTCRRLGIATVAIHSTAEGSPLHAELADEAIALSDAPNPIAAYLDVDNIISIARTSGADAIHPGYGLLSENPDLAEACAESGIAFVGPPTSVIRLMGNKREARRRVSEAGVPVLPGAELTSDTDDVESAAESVGYPLMVKASEGGGGIGMQVVSDPRRLTRAVSRTRSSARRAFGSEDVYLERFIPGARHVEVQIVGDSEGLSSHLWERECSVQRRHQKVIEEAPSPSISQQTRDSLTSVATRAAQTVGYRNVGTFEFLLDQDDGFYFIEANTRLQVEHAVTEMITGIDIVERQLRIAAGEPTPSESPPINGHAIQCRIYAEDPDTFIPSPGTLEEFHIPILDGLRVDTGFRAGDEVSSYFDPLLAKVISWGRTRADSVSLMARALDDARISGLKTNVPTLRKAIASPEFASGRYTTDLLASLLAT